MMFWINMLDAWLDQFDLTSPFQIIVMLLVLLKVYTLQVSERLDEVVERVPYGYGWFRRAATVAESVAWLWVLLYQVEEHVGPRAPGVFLAIASLSSVAARLIIIHKDYYRSHRLGREVASIADVLPSVRRSAKSGERQITR